MVIIGIIIFKMYNYVGLILFLGVLIILELSFYLLVTHLRRKFQWLITPKDEIPKIDKKGLAKFIKHGYDPELGWVRKPNTFHDEYESSRKTRYHIDDKGSRVNPNQGALSNVISCYGDSFTFCRKVNDDETWQYYLSELANIWVLNFGVGNYGIDQALLRMKREYPKNKSKIVIMGIVPSTIVRILCVWKHYNEFGNTFGFKPRFKLKGKKLVLIKNIIDDEEKFYHLDKYIKKLQENDYFYTTKFKKEIIKFPYFLSILTNVRRNIPLISSIIWTDIFKKTKSIYDLSTYNSALEIIMRINLELRYKLFKNPKAVKLLSKIIDEFIVYSKEQNFIPILLFLPQKDDVLFIKNKEFYYKKFIQKKSKKLLTIDLTNYFLKTSNLDEFYSADSKYGDHLNKSGNKFVAQVIYDVLRERGLLDGKAKN